jgi:hypothetical protein
MQARQRRKKNRISRLKNFDGVVVENVDELGRMTTRFYKDLYRSEGTQNMEAVLGTVPIKVTREMNDDLLKPFVEKEVK